MATVEQPPDFDMKAYLKEYNKRPEVKAKRKEYMREYNKRPEVAEKRATYQRAYRAKRKGKTIGS